MQYVEPRTFLQNCALLRVPIGNGTCDGQPTRPSLPCVSSSASATADVDRRNEPRKKKRLDHLMCGLSLRISVKVCV